MNGDWWTTFLDACDELVLSLIHQDLQHIEWFNALLDRLLSRAD